MYSAAGFAYSDGAVVEGGSDEDGDLDTAEDDMIQVSHPPPALPRSDALDDESAAGTRSHESPCQLRARQLCMRWRNLAALPCLPSLPRVRLDVL